METATERHARGVRPIERDDLSQVAALYQSVVYPDQRVERSRLVREFERLLFDQPWADSETPSLVLEDGDRIRGFIASHTRRIRFDGTPLRLVYAGQFVTDEETSRKKGLGALLLRRLLSGPQDLTITDGATPVVQAMWERIGGKALPLQSVAWTYFLHPATAAGGWALRRRGMVRTARAATPILSLADAAVRRLSHRRSSTPLRDTELEPATVVEAVEGLIEGARVLPDYEEPYLRWLFAEMAGVTQRGALVRRAVYTDQELAGWYVAYLKRRGIGQVLQIAAGRRHRRDVIENLIDHALRSETAALEGRLEPLIFELAAERRVLLRFSERVLIHSRQPELVRAVSAGEAFLTRMDGEWWVGTHLVAEPSEERVAAGAAQ